MSLAGAVVLAGGEARRLPGKVLLDAGAAEPLVARVVRNLTTPAPAASGAAESGESPTDAVADLFARGNIEIVVSSSRMLAGRLASLVTCAVVADRWDARGPLGGVLSAFAVMRSTWVFVAAADAPYLDAAFAARLARARRPGDDAVVPVHDGDRLEPLAALYRRDAVLRAGPGVLAAGNGSLRALIAKIPSRTVTVEAADRVLLNVNTPADYHAFKEALS